MNRELTISRTEQKISVNDYVKSTTVLEPTCENEADESPSLDQRLNVKGPVKRGNGFEPVFRLGKPRNLCTTRETAIKME